MEWLKQNAKKLAGVIVMALGLGAAIAYMVPGCDPTGEALHKAKEKVEAVMPMLPDADAPVAE